MESSIAVFLWRWPACERLPTKRGVAGGAEWMHLAQRRLSQNTRWSWAMLMLHLGPHTMDFVDCTRTGSLLQ